MTHLEVKYIVDTNTLIKLEQDVRSTPNFRQLVMLPEAVLDEARGFPDLPALTALKVSTTNRILECVAKIMQTIPVGDTSLVDLYRNKGGADAFVVATTLVLIEDGKERLFEPEWAIATDDKAVARISRGYGVRTISSEEFQKIVLSKNG